MSGWDKDTAWRLLHLDAADHADKLAEGLGRARDGRKAIAGRVVTESRLRAAARRLRALADDEGNAAPSDFFPGVLTDPCRPYAAWGAAREITRKALSDDPLSDR